MHFEQLLSLQDVLDAGLCSGQFTLAQYEIEWSSLLETAGYSQSDYEDAVNSRWDYLGALDAAVFLRRGSS